MDNFTIVVYSCRHWVAMAFAADDRRTFAQQVRDVLT